MLARVFLTGGCRVEAGNTYRALLVSGNPGLQDLHNK